MLSLLHYTDFMDSIDCIDPAAPTQVTALMHTYQQGLNFQGLMKGPEIVTADPICNPPAGILQDFK